MNSARQTTPNSEPVTEPVVAMPSGAARLSLARKRVAVEAGGSVRSGARDVE